MAETKEIPQICIKIMVYDKCHVEEVVYYRNKLPMWIVEQWKWYFEYLAARIKVKNPRRKVELVICAQTLLQGEEYIKAKTITLLRAKRIQLKKQQERHIDVDLFGFAQEIRSKKIEALMTEIEALERGEFNYYVPQTYINTIKDWI